MNPITDMLQTHPGKPTQHFEEVDAAIQACFECAQITTVCADACLAENDEDLAMLRECIRLDLDTSDICVATGRLIARQARPDPALWRAALESCIQACKSCAAECAKHQDRHDHCRVCREACERCAQACQSALDAIPQGGAETRH